MRSIREHQSPSHTPAMNRWDLRFKAHYHLYQHPKMKYLSINLPNTHEASLRETAKPRWAKPKESETGGGVSRGRGPGDSVSLRRRFSPSGSPDPVWLPSKPQPVAWWTRATRLCSLRGEASRYPTPNLTVKLSNEDAVVGGSSDREIGETEQKTLKRPP